MWITFLEIVEKGRENMGNRVGVEMWISCGQINFDRFCLGEWGVDKGFGRLGMRFWDFRTDDRFLSQCMIKLAMILIEKMGWGRQFLVPPGTILSSQKYGFLTVYMHKNMYKCMKYTLFMDHLCIIYGIYACFMYI